MPRPRFSMRRLLALVAVSAAGCAFLALAADRRAGPLQEMTLAILALATAAVPLGWGRSRAFALGFAAAGWAYFATWKASGLGGLPTTRWLASAYGRLDGRPASRAPGEVADFLQDVLAFLFTGHLVLTLASAMLGGLVALAARSAMLRLARRRLPAASGAPFASP